MWGVCVRICGNLTQLPSHWQGHQDAGHSGPERPGTTSFLQVGKEPQSARGRARLGSAPVSHGGGDSHFFRVYRVRAAARDQVL